MVEVGILSGLFLYVSDSVAAQIAAMRKQQEGPNSNNQMRTPAYFSQLKHDKMLKDQEQKAQQQLLSRLPHGVSILPYWENCAI